MNAFGEHYSRGKFTNIEMNEWDKFIKLLINHQLVQFCEKLCLVSGINCLNLGMKSWRVFYDRSLLGRCVRGGFVLQVLE